MEWSTILGIITSVVIASGIIAIAVGSRYGNIESIIGGSSILGIAFIIAAILGGVYYYAVRSTGSGKYGAPTLSNPTGYIPSTTASTPTTASTAPTKPITSMNAMQKTGLGVVGLLVLAGIIGGAFYVRGTTGLALGGYLGGFLGFIIIVFAATYLAQQTDKPGNFVPTTFFRMLYYFLPYGIITFIGMADLLNVKYKYTGGLLASIVMFIFNRLVGYYGLTPKDVDRTVIPLKDSNYCGVPGLGQFGSNFLPQGMLFNLTSLSYLATLITFETNENTKYVIPSWSFLASIFFISSVMTIKNDCFDASKGHGYWITEKVAAASGSKTLGITATLLTTLIVSGGAGALGAYIHNYLIEEGNIERFAGHIDPKAEQNAKNKKDENIVNVSTALSEVCPAIAEDQIVAEIYQNGKKLGSSLN